MSESKDEVSASYAAIETGLPLTVAALKYLHNEDRLNSANIVARLKQPQDDTLETLKIFVRSNSNGMLHATHSANKSLEDCIYQMNLLPYNDNLAFTAAFASEDNKNDKVSSSDFAETTTTTTTMTTTMETKTTTPTSSCNRCGCPTPSYNYRSCLAIFHACRPFYNQEDFHRPSTVVNNDLYIQVANACLPFYKFENTQERGSSKKDDPSAGACENCF